MKLSIAIPVFNEARTLPLLFAELPAVLAGLDCDFSRNFGDQAALTAAIDFCSGDAVVIMDADLQDPPDLLPEMLRLYRQGFDVVSPQRVARRGDSWFKGMVGWLGMSEALLPFERRPRTRMLAGFGASGMALLRFFYAAYLYFRRSVVPGRTSIAFLQRFFFGMTPVSIGLVGQYVARIYDESKSRPLYVLNRAINIDPDAVALERAVILPGERMPDAVCEPPLG